MVFRLSHADATLSELGSINAFAIPGLSKHNPGLKLANAFGVFAIDKVFVQAVASRTPTAQSRDQKDLYVQYGCGMSVADGWRSFDSSFTLRVERLPLLGKLYTKNAVRFPLDVEYGDIVKGLPVAANSCRGVYASHVLEHLALDEFRKAIRNTHRILNSEGIFRLVVPDISALVKNYLREADTNEQAALNFMTYSGLGVENGPKGVKAAVKVWLGTPPHRWMWDEKSMTHELKEAGFTKVRRCSFNDCADPMFKSVEEPGRWEYEPLALEVGK